MENVLNIIMIQLIEHFVNVNKDGMDNIVQLNMIVNVQIIQYVLGN